MSESENARETAADRVVVDGRELPVEVDEALGQFRIRTGDAVAFLGFTAKGRALSLNHTEVPAALRGKGLGDALAGAAMRYAESRHMTVQPYCPFVAAYIKRHVEYHRMVDPGFSGSI
jgi:predicted GNAT family acetyltransferase